MPTATTKLASAPAYVDLTWSHGDTTAFTFTFQDDQAAPINYSGSTFAAVVQETLVTGATEWAFTVDDTNKATGVVVLTTPTDADLPTSGYWDLRETDGSGNVLTLVAGKVAIPRTVTP